MYMHMGDYLLWQLFLILGCVEMQLYLWYTGYIECCCFVYKQVKVIVCNILYIKVWRKPCDSFATIKRFDTKK